MSRGISANDDYYWNFVKPRLDQAELVCYNCEEEVESEDDLFLWEGEFSLCEECFEKWYLETHGRTYQEVYGDK